MKRSLLLLPLSFFASLSVIACGGSTPSGGPGSSGNTGGTAGTGGSTIPGAGDSGNSGSSAGGGGGIAGVTSDGGVSGVSGPDVLPAVGFTGMVTGALTAQNSTWGPGVVTMTGPVTVGSGVTLNIQAGTSVYGAFPITAMGGSFNCLGNSTYPTTIADGSVALVGGKHSIQFCIIKSGAATAVDVNGATLSAAHLEIQKYATSGVYIHGAGATASINFATIGTITTLFTGDTVGKEATAVVIDADAAMNKTSITNSILGFLNNGTNIGLKINGPSNTHLAYDNITSAGSVLTTSDAPVGILTKDPGIADIPNLDHNLAYYAPDLDQADPAADFSLEPQPNGGRANLGYDGGTKTARVTTVQVVSPQCEQFTPGQMATVTWLSSPNTGGKKLEVSVDNGTTWAPLATIAAGSDTGSTQVTLPSTPTDQGLLRLSQDNDPMRITDVSDKPFAIGKALPAVCDNARPACTGDCKPFTVICYTGYRDGQMPTGMPGVNEPTLQQVTEDLTILAQYTHGIRTYGSNPQLHDGGIVPGVTDSLKLNLHMGIWLDDSYSDEVNMKALYDALVVVAAGHTSIKSLVVGNEYLLRVRQSKGDTKKAEARLVSYINYVRSKAPANLSVTTGESYPDWLNASDAMFKAVDIVTWHVHPWWEQIPIGGAATQVQAAHEKILAKMKGYGITKPERLGETGYPWGQDNGPAKGTEANQAKYLHDLNQYSLKSGLEYWVFEGFDEAWKGAEGGVGAQWGMWTTVRKPHAIITEINTLVPAAEGWNK